MNKKELDLSCFQISEKSVLNSKSEKIEIVSDKIIRLDNPRAKYCKIRFKADMKNAGGYLLINGQYEIPVNSVSVMEIKTPVEMKVTLVVAAESELELKEISFEELEQYEDLVEECDKSNNVLVVTPNYPSSANLYLCAFAHSRNREYADSGLKIQVASISGYNWFETLYTIDGISVYKGSYESLKRLLSTRRYTVTVTHFVDEHLYSIYDGYVYPTDRMIFICHGPETVYRYLVNVTRPYFTKEIENVNNPSFELKDKYIRKYAQKDNVEWVFVSDWLKEYSEEQLGLKFKHCRVVNNIISENLFPYKEKTAEKRKKVLVIRKFDNIIQHSIDQVVMAILELSKREFFDELDFEIYGDGDYYDILTAPIKNLNNVNFHRRFIPNNLISEIHEEAGILLIPSRHDAHAVAMGEGAASGLVVVGSAVTSNPYFMQQERFHTLADPEDPIELADIVERLYKNPQEFLQISRELSKFTRENFCIEKTVKKEIDLIKEKTAECGGENILPFCLNAAENPVLSVVVPAYNVEKYIEKCVISLLNHKNSYKTEVIIVNDGSKDRTSEIAHKLEQISHGIVKVIDKENGGHGSTINAGIAAARGKYFRLVDGDDWVDGDNLSRLVDILESEEADIVLTTGSYEYVEKSLLENIIEYDMLKEGRLYDFDNLTYEGYGFKTYGPLLTTTNIKTELLKKAAFHITEKKPYVDMEFNSFSLKYVKTLKYYDLNIYRYLIGRAGQTISREAWKKKYKDHSEIIFNILATIENDHVFPEGKKRYIHEHIITQMVDSQIFMYDVALAWNEIDGFLEKLRQYPEVFRKAMEYIENKKGNCQLILRKYKHHKGNRSIIIPGVYETINDDPFMLAQEQNNLTVKRRIKLAAKYVLPYGMVKKIILKRNGGN